MDSSGAELVNAGPHSRALRRVITLNQEIGFQVRRTMGLRDTDYTAMALLLRRPMGPTELARALHITTASATAMVDRLVRAGHVVREPHEEDRRRMTVRAVDRSRAEVAAHVAPMVAMVEEQLAALDESGRQAVLQFLTGTAARMEAHLDELRERPAEKPAETPAAEPAGAMDTAAPRPGGQLGGTGGSP
ncbi:MarR family transcriptional regulator [Kocuria tytonicola]|uniref:MarR family winged helix-turn-helix transcriptional regulator n=1 Tax=Kocuria tytonicola TaxID=2055946 RepID=UPI000EF96864|nr:MarR family transcriptional regulator [Kocuria tytonicola]RLZ03016.1 MarR family transcriptional regulator [Kocuria tytonicola]